MARLTPCRFYMNCRSFDCVRLRLSSLRMTKTVEAGPIREENEQCFVEEWQ